MPRTPHCLLALRLACRVLEVCDRIKGALGSNTECTITPAPPDSLAAVAGAASFSRRACKDVTSCEAGWGRAGRYHLLAWWAGWKLSLSHPLSLSLCVFFVAWCLLRCSR